MPRGMKALAETIVQSKSDDESMITYSAAALIH